MNDPLTLARPELLRIRPYTPGVYEPGFIRLNANESPWRTPGDKTDRGLNIYPPPRPDVLANRLAELYDVTAAEILMTRGSSEAIDVLIRGFCVSGRDSILIMPPTFDMYRLYGAIQNAGIVEVPLRKQADFSVDVDRLLNLEDPAVKLVFVCSPNNPTGSSIPHDLMDDICNAFRDRALVVIDEAYFEFSDADHFLRFQQRYRHVVLLRTLSKFVSLAGARCGALIADPAIVEFLGRILPPYTFPTPSIELVQEALTDDALDASRERVATLKMERRRVADALRASTHVTAVYPSDANFLLIETRDAAYFSELAYRARVLVRTFPGQAELAKAVRITIGRPQDNDRLLRAISGGDVDHAD